jgi:hypothetical protein
MIENNNNLDDMEKYCRYINFTSNAPVVYIIDFKIIIIATKKDILFQY